MATLTLREVEDAHIRAVLEECGGNISETARRLDIYRSTLKRRLRKIPGLTVTLHAVTPTS